MKTLTIALGLCSTVVSPVVWAGTNDGFWSENGDAFSQLEKQDRSVDEAALSSQNTAAQKLNALIKKYRNQPQEAQYLFRLAEILEQSAAMDFRVGIGGVLKDNRKNFKSDHAQAVVALDRLLSRFPGFEDRARATFMRGRAHEELGNIKLATRDYRALVQTHPKAPECIPAYMALANFSMSAQKFNEAILSLKVVEKSPSSPYYPFALYQLAWAYYSLKKIPSALAYAERLVAYYRAKPNAGQGDLALLETVFKDAPVFFFAGYEMGLPKTRAPHALAYFKKLDNGKDLSGMLSLYAKLLRSNDHAKELRSFNAVVIASGGTLQSDGYELLLTELEHDLNQARYDSAQVTVKSVASAHARTSSSELTARGEKLVYEGALKIQARFAKASKAGTQSLYTQLLAKTLASLYGAFFQMVQDEDDVRVRTAHANLGETLFAVGNYEGATAQYRWIVQNGSWSDAATVDASLKSIASRGESLRQKDLIPKALKAVAFSQKPTRAANPLVTQWLGWIDLHAKKAPQTPGLDQFDFEANRTLYAQGQVRESVARLRAFALENPKSSVALPSATLVVDTYVMSQDWQALAKISEELQENDVWAGSAFQKRVTTLAADAHFKQAQMLSSRHSYDEAIEQVNELNERYGSNPNRVSSYVLAGDAALAKHDRDEAMRYYGMAVAAAPQGESAKKTRLIMAKIEEERFRFLPAAQLYQNYLRYHAASLNRVDQNHLKLRVMTLAWLGESPAMVQSTVSDRVFCAKESASCERFRALVPLMTKGAVASKTARTALRLAATAPVAVRAIYATIALENPGALSLVERRTAVRALIANWQAVEPMARFTLIPRMMASVPRVLAAERQAIARTPLSADERSMTRRLNLIKDFEAFTVQAVALPWAHIQSEAMSEAGQAYSDFVIAIRTIPVPKSLSADGVAAYDKMISATVNPFERKSAQLKQQAVAVAAQAPMELDSGFLKNADEQNTLLKARWAEAIENGQWAQVAYFAQESHRRSGAWLGAAGRSVSLAQAGAVTEARGELMAYCRTNRATSSAAMKTCSSLPVMPALSVVPKIKRSKTMVGKR